MKPFDPTELAFDPVPLAAGPDFAVHTARWRGASVLVKAARPGADGDRRESLLRREHGAFGKLGKALGLVRLGDGRLALVRPFEPGVPLATLIERALIRQRYQGARRWNTPTRALVAALCEAVHALHKKGLVHNDLKPDNVLVHLDPSSGRLVVTLVDLALTARAGEGGPGGTVAYAAPERLQGAPGSEASDLWSVAAMIYELLAGTRPYPDDEPADALLARRTPVDRIPRPSQAYAWQHFPPEVQRALASALDPDPSRRPRNLRALAKQLGVADLSLGPSAGALADPGQTPTLTTNARARAPRVPVDPAHPATPRRFLTALTIISLVASLVAAGLSLWGLVAGTRAPAMCAAANDACHIALTHPSFSKVLGIPVLAWAFALHLVLAALAVTALATRRGFSPQNPRTSALQAARTAGAVVLLAGTIAYLAIAIGVVRVACPLCLTLHGLGLVAAITAIVALAPATRAALRALARPATWALFVALTVLFVGLTVSADRATRAASSAATTATATALAQRAPDPQRAQLGPLAPLAVAPTCAAPLIASARELPPAEAALVIAPPTDRPVVVAHLDLDCPACRAEHAALTPLYRRLAATQEAGLRIVLWAKSRACNRYLDRNASDDQALCDAPAALVCAARHGGGLAALDYLDWEFQAEPGYYTHEARARWLDARLGDVAARCLDAELRVGPVGTVGAHAAFAAQARRTAQSESFRGCDRPDAWWCWAGTPSFVVVEPRPGGDLAPQTARDLDALAALSGEDRRAALAACLTPDSSVGQPGFARPSANQEP